MVPILDSLKNFFSRSVRGIPPTPEERAAEETATRTQGMENLTSVGTPAPSESARVNAGADVAPVGGLPADPLVDMTLKDAGENPVKVVEVITAASGMSMAEAQACVDNTPSVVLRSVRADVGRQFARDVSMAGGTTILAPAESASSGHVPATSDAAVPDAVADLPADAVADLVLHAVGAQPVAVVKALYAHCGCDLKGAKDLADQAPVTVMEGASREAIASAYAALREAGAEVEVIIS